MFPLVVFLFRCRYLRRQFQNDFIRRIFVSHRNAGAYFQYIDFRRFERFHHFVHVHLLRIGYEERQDDYVAGYFVQNIFRFAAETK